MKGRINTKLGEIQINPEVIAKYAGITAVECFGIVGMAAVSMKDGLVKLLKKESLTHGINVDIEENHIILDFHVIVADRECQIQSRRIYRHGSRQDQHLCRRCPCD